MQPSEFGQFEQRFGYQFRDRGLLEAALTHSSALRAGEVRTGERLEFLGDAVVDLVVADLLLRAFPACNEGQLSKLRSLLVRTQTLASKAAELGVGDWVRLGRGEDRSGGRTKSTILAATYEAIVGAIFVEGGFQRAHAVVRRHFEREITGGRLLAAQDWKTMLQERAQAELRVSPRYRLVGERGPAHAKVFTVEVWLGELCAATGEGSSKRAAEQVAARHALGGNVWEVSGEGARSGGGGDAD